MQHRIQHKMKINKRINAKYDMREYENKKMTFRCRCN